MEEAPLKKGEQVIGRGRRGWSTKIHLALTYQGVLNFILSPGQKQDERLFHTLCESWSWEQIKYVICDKGYEGYEIKKKIKDYHCQPVIPPKSSRVFPGTYDKALYQTRHHIERFLGHLKENKRLAMRYDKLDVTFTSFICCAMTKITELLC